MEQTGIINSPVAYSNSTEIKQSLNVIAANINQNIELIHSYTREQMQNWIISVYSIQLPTIYSFLILREILKNLSSCIHPTQIS